jgi:dTDP-4-amino-4,6-dideoxygalactose transaminase
MKVPFLDLNRQYKSIKEDVHTAIQEVIESSAFAGGVFVEVFEKEFASFCGCRHAIAVGNGTEALWLAMRGLGIGSGDEVITVPNTFIATAEAISHCGAIPIFVDVDRSTYNIAPQNIEKAITARTKAIIPVHLFGQTADMDPILEIARSNGLKVIEDASQSHGAEYKGRKAGSIGDAGCFSFYPGKNLGAYGEAGAIITNSDKVSELIRMLRDHGQVKKYHHRVIGWNARMDGIQAAILSVKLKNLSKWTDSRRKNAAIYNNRLKGIKNVLTPIEAEYSKHVYHIYAIRTKDRDQLIKRLSQNDIHCMIHYPIPLHCQEAYQYLGISRGSFPVAEQAAAEHVSLPMYAELTVEEIEHVAATIIKLQ